MKTILFVAGMLATGLTAKAQFTQPGQKIIGGTFSIHNGNSSSSTAPGVENKTTNFSISGNAGKFIKKNVLTSVTAFYSNGFTKQITPTNTSKNILNALYVSFGKTYFKEIAKKLYFGIGGSAGIGYNTAIVKNTIQTDGSNWEGYNIGLSIAPLLSYQITNKFLINCGPSANFFDLNYSTGKIKYTQAGQIISTGKSQSVNLNTGFFGSPLSNISIGFSYLL